MKIIIESDFNFLFKEFELSKILLSDSHSERRMQRVRKASFSIQETFSLRTSWTTKSVLLTFAFSFFLQYSDS
jgi:hypothetical protein